MGMCVTETRTLETEVMALLEQIIITAEEAQALVQDDSHISARDRDAIQEKMLHLRGLTIEIDHAIDTLLG
jgi:hypothetical protein